MTSDPQGFAASADALLKSMEAAFLGVLAEEPAVVPAAADPAVPDDPSPKAVVIVRATEEVATNLLNCMAHYRLAGCANCAASALAVMYEIVTELISEGIRLHGWCRNDEEEN